MGRGKKERGTESQARERISDQRKLVAILKALYTCTRTHIHRERERISEIRGFFPWGLSFTFLRPSSTLAVRMSTLCINPFVLAPE